MQAVEAGCRIQLCIEEDAIDHESHEERLDHLQARARQSNEEQRAHGEAMRPEPAQILAHVLPAPALAFAVRFRLLRLAVLSLRGFAVRVLLLAILLRSIQFPARIILDATAIP